MRPVEHDGELVLHLERLAVLLAQGLLVRLEAAPAALLRPGLLGALVHNGTGISRGTICGRLVAEMACDEGSNLLDTMLAMGRPNRNLPAPVLGWGVRMYARRLQLQAGLEM